MSLFRSVRNVATRACASGVPILLARLADEDATDVVTALVRALGELRDARAVTRLADLARGGSGLFQRHPASVRVAAVRALAGIGTADALAVVASLKADRNAEIRRAAEEGAP